MELSLEDREALRYAKTLLENPGLTAKITNLIGVPIEKAFALLPEKWSEIVKAATTKSLQTALEMALVTMDEHAERRSREILHKLAVVATGAGGGTFGLAGLPLELPVSTAIMLRSIADIARSEGERLSTAESKLGTRHANIKPGAYHWIGASSGIRGLGFNYVIVQEFGITELYIDRGDAEENKGIFDQLQVRKQEIEERFGGTLSWERLDAKRACRIKHVIEAGGYRSPEQNWPEIQAEMVASMIRFEAALKPALDSLGPF